MTCIIHKKGNVRESDSHGLINNASLDFVNWKSIPLPGKDSGNYSLLFLEWMEIF